MNKKYKGQGALEYLLLIGGAVLIAVIVIALLVGMGGQSRDAAQEQADRAQQASDVPQPAQIVSVDRNTTACILRAQNNWNLNVDVNVSWRPIGEGGAYNVYIEDSQRRQLAFRENINPNNQNISINDINLGMYSGLQCGDSYYVYITTTKNQQTVSSARFRFGWW